MSAERMIRIEHGDARIKIPERVVLRNFLDSISGERTRILSPQDRPALGEYWPGQGGIYVGEMMARNGSPGYSVISATADCVRGKKLKYGSQGEDEPGAQCYFDGLANTIALRDSKHSHPAAEWTAEIVIDNHRDFYLPARGESWLQFMNAGDDFEKVWHWTSTQYGPGNAWVQDFDDGFQSYLGKANEFAVRPVRRIIHSVI